MDTRLHIPAKKRLALSLLGLKYRVAVGLGRRVRHWVSTATAHDSAVANVDRTRLDAIDVARIAENYGESIRGSAEHHVPRLKRELAHLERAVDDETTTNRMIVATAACKKELEKGGIRSALNIGCGFDLSFYWLSKRFPDVTFTSIDFTDEHRRVLGRALPDADTRSNWTTRTGYALDLLERGELRADLVLLSGVASMMFPGEWRAYAAQLAKFAKVVVLADVWYARGEGPLWDVPRPEAIDADRSLVVAGSQGGQYMHNHHATLESAGFHIRRSRLLGDSCYVLDLVADGPTRAANAASPTTHQENLS